MKANEQTLLWAREHWTGNIWEDSASSTHGYTSLWPFDDDVEAETKAQKTKHWGKVKLYRVVFEPVSEEEQKAHLKKQKQFFRDRKAKAKQ